MGWEKIRYLVRRQARGRIYHYWQPTKDLIDAGFRAFRLSDNPDEARTQAEAHNRKLDAWRIGAPLAAPRYRPDSLAALDELFQRSDDFARMGERTRRDFTYNIKAGLEWAGALQVAALSKGVILDWHQAQRDKRGPAAARNSATALRRLLSFGVNRDWLTVNPALALNLPTPRSRERVWTVAERDRFIAAAEADGRPSMAVAVMLGWCLGQRPADLRTLTWAAYDGRAVQIKQAKTGRRIAVPALPELRRMLDKAPRKAVQIVVSETSGRPYLESDFQHRFADIRAKAGLQPELQFRLFRHTLATALGMAGCTEDQIMAITGHVTRGVLRHYMRPDQTVADEAMRRLQGAERKAKLKTELKIKASQQ